MKTVIKILIVLFCISPLTGCEQIFTGLGFGAASTEMLNTYEDILEAKRVELNSAYDQAIANMQAATDPNQLAFEREKAEQIQIARVTNLGALTVVREIKSEQPQEEGGSLTLLHTLIPILGAWGVNELRKRVASDKKRASDKHGKELALRQLATMPEKNITAPVVKELLYRDIGEARKT